MHDMVKIDTIVFEIVGGVGVLKSLVVSNIQDRIMVN